MHLDADALSALCRPCRRDIAEGVHLVSRALPDGCVAAASVVDGELWLLVDLEKPYAMRHLRALLHEQHLDLPDTSGVLP